VKVDGTTITISGGVISSTGGSIVIGPNLTGIAAITTGTLDAVNAVNSAGSFVVTDGSNFLPAGMLGNDIGVNVQAWSSTLDQLSSGYTLSAVSGTILVGAGSASQVILGDGSLTGIDSSVTSAIAVPVNTVLSLVATDSGGNLQLGNQLRGSSGQTIVDSSGNLVCLRPILGTFLFRATAGRGAATGLTPGVGVSTALTQDADSSSGFVITSSLVGLIFTSDTSNVTLGDGTYAPISSLVTANPTYAGTKTATGTATTTFTVTIGHTMADTNYSASAEGSNLLSSAVHWTTNKTTTTFDVVYATGLTGSVAFDWTVTPYN